jgi:hypothetical protein
MMKSNCVIGSAPGDNLVQAAQSQTSPLPRNRTSVAGVSDAHHLSEMQVSFVFQVGSPCYTSF